jgi:C-terminal processing protease CtpA/Prc
MAVLYPLFVFEKDDCSMQLVEKPEDLFFHLEEFDIQNDEYLFWDANGTGVCLRMKKKKVVAIENCAAAKPLSEAFLAYCQSLDLVVDLANKPIETWTRIQDAVKRRPKKKGRFARLFQTPD